MLTSKQKSFFSSRYILTKDGVNCGEYAYRFLPGKLKILLSDGSTLIFKRRGGVARSYYELFTSNNKSLCIAKPSGILKSNWNMSLLSGEHDFQETCEYNNFEVISNQKITANAKILNESRKVWEVAPLIDMPLPDQIMIGLLIHTKLGLRKDG